METDNLTVAGQGVSEDQRTSEIGKRMGEAVYDYFHLREECVPTYADDFGPTKEDAVAALVHELESIYIDWGIVCNN